MARVVSPRLVGRREELARLLEVAQRAASERRSATVLLFGEAGIGKTRLLAELRERLTADGMAMISGACLPPPASVPLAALNGLLRDLRSRDELVEQRLGQAHDRLVELLQGDEAEATPARLYELALAVVESASTRLPLVLVVEDLHWADDVTRGLVGFLARYLREMPVTLVVSYRADELHRRHPLRGFLAELERRAAPEGIELRRLTRSELAEMGEAITGRLLDRDTLDRLARLSQGNPFLAEELLATGVQGNLRNVVMERVGLLDDADFDLLRGASIHPVIDPLLLARVIGRDPADVEHRLRDLIEDGFLVPGQGGPTFRHELTRELLYQDLLPSERRRMHAAYAEALAELTPQPVIERAAHLWEAGDRVQALPASIAAAEAAAHRGAADDARTFYERALELMDEAGAGSSADQPDRTELVVATSDAMQICRQFDRAIALLETEISRETDPYRAGRLWVELAGARSLSARPVGCRDAMDHALGLLPPQPASRERAFATVYGSQLAQRGGRAREALDLAEEAALMARSLGDEELGRAAARRRAVALAELLDPRAALPLLELVATCRAAGDDAGEQRYLGELVHVLECQGDYCRTLEVAERGTRLARAGGEYLVHGIWFEFHRVIALDRLGRWDEGLALGETVSDLLGGLEADWVDGIAWTVGPLLARRGDPRAVPLLESGWALAATSEVDGEQLGPIAAALIGLAGRAGDVDRAIGVADTALPVILPGLVIPSAEVVAAAAGAVADAHLAHHAGTDDAARRVSEWTGELGDALDGLKHDEAPISAPHLYLAQATAELGRLDRAGDAEAWGALADGWSTLKRPFETGYAAYRTAEALMLSAGLRRRATAEATDRLREAASIFRALGAAPLLADVEALGRRARIRLDAPTKAQATGEPAVETPSQAPTARLTEREAEVLRLLADGRSNGEIARSLFITTKTASTHVSNILRKLDATNRVEAATIAHRTGLLTPPSG